MGTWLDMIIEARDRDSALAAAEAAVRAVEAAESRLSTWNEDSELSRLNRSPAGSWFSLSTKLASDLGEVIEWHRQTDGWFNPGVAAQVRVWGLRGLGRVPADDEISRAVAASRLSGLVLADGRARRTVEGFGVEEGGFGKGAALRDASLAASAQGARCVRFNFGGQTHLAGECAAEIVEIAHP
jgi:thiamine biosynthesis lipoprotein